MLFIIILCSITAISLFLLAYTLARDLKNSNDRNTKLQEKLNKLFTEMSSIRVKHGMTFEKWIPFSTHFEKLVGPKENAYFIAAPIDYVYFGEDKIVFVEIKTGDSKLNHKQQRIRGLVKDKKVEWVEIRDSDLDEVNKS